MLWSGPLGGANSMLQPWGGGGSTVKQKRAHSAGVAINKGQSCA